VLIEAIAALGLEDHQGLEELRWNLPHHLWRELPAMFFLQHLLDHGAIDIELVRTSAEHL
jgi:hypothetical protein